jgi:hypothetical protein
MSKAKKASREYTMNHPELSLRQKMNRIYKDISGFEIPKSEEQIIKKSQGSPVYGEITLTSLDKLFDFLKLKASDVLFDLGSGVGKVVIHTASVTPVKKAVGVELSKARHDDALAAYQNALEYFPQIKGRCQFLCGDLMEADLKQATVIYTCSTAFSIKFMNQIARMLTKYTHPFRLITLQELPVERAFRRTDTIKLDMSWVRQTPVHIYERNLD